VRRPSYRWFSQPAALDAAVEAGTIGGNTLTGTVASDLSSVPTDSAPVHTDLAPVPTDFAPVSLIPLLGGLRSETAPSRAASRCTPP
jgi:hypothetical protein